MTAVNSLFLNRNYHTYNTDPSVIKVWAEAARENAEMGATTGINFFTENCKRDSRVNLNPLTNLQYREMAASGDYDTAEAMMQTRLELIA